MKRLTVAARGVSRPRVLGTMSASAEDTPTFIVVARDGRAVDVVSGSVLRPTMHVHGDAGRPPATFDTLKGDAVNRHLG